ncbi:MAG: multicopper oxidase domain-containing protein [Flavobacteriaceae bacterium]|jgi:FtsP/CotA-like multicopper oxidase with cupredoxin domain|nr:multicopper oxidase domain-containing protein [Flavobacteriaceae bacterium]
MTLYINRVVIALIALTTYFGNAQNIKRYDLYVTDTIVNFTGKEKHAIAVNGQIPMPTLEFTEGDVAEIYVHNKMKSSPTALHWHGLYVPNKEDGVPYLTQMPIQAGETFKYSFPIIQNGTYWYHSHQGMQEQIGMYGMMILKKKEGDPSFRQGIDNLPSIPLVLSEWTDTNPHTVHRMLRNANDWAGIKKGSTQSYSEAIKEGHLGTKITNEWKRMQAMDVSDVYYDEVLINGKVNQQIKEFLPNSKVRLQIANGGASSYFWLTYSGGKYQVVAHDGNDVVPVQVDRLLLAPSETVDIIVEIGGNNKVYELVATTEDRSKYATLALGDGVVVAGERLPKLNYFAGMKMMNEMMNMDGSMKDMGMQMSLQTMDMNSVMYPEIKKAKHNHTHHAMPEIQSEETAHAHHAMPEIQSEETAHAHHAMPESQSEETTHVHHVMPESQSEEIAHAHHAMPESQSEETTHAHHAMPESQSEETTHQQHKISSSNQIPNLGSEDIVTLNYNMLQATVNTTLNPEAPVRELQFTLTGNMNRYIWSMDNKVVSESDKIQIKKGERVRIVLHNASMMRHPMHLHGHDFRVINQYGAYSPLKNVIDIMPMETNIIEFEANNEGDWFFHCHILYHMMSGMGRLFTYEGQAANPYIANPEKEIKKIYADDRNLFLQAQNEVASNGNFGLVMLHNTRWAVRTEWKVGYNSNKGYEFESQVGRFIGEMQWFIPFVGLQYSNQKGNHWEQNMFGQQKDLNGKPRLSVGFVYTLPLLIQLQAEVDHYGMFRMILRREDIPLTPRLRGAFSIGTDKEYMGGLKYVLSKNISLSGNYYSQYGFGAGVSFNY